MARIVCDPLGLFLIAVFYTLLVYVDFAVLYYILYNATESLLWHFLHAVVFNACIVLAITAHVRTVLSNAGRLSTSEKLPVMTDQLFTDSPPIEEKNVQIPGDSLAIDIVTRCPICNVLRPPDARHCRTCKCCVRHVHHHCPWVNNCVSASNQTYFMHFLIWTCIALLYAALLAIFALVSRPKCNNKTMQQPHRASCREEERSTKRIEILHESSIIVLWAVFFTLCVFAFMRQMAAYGDNHAFNKFTSTDMGKQLRFKKIREIFRIFM